MKKCSTLLLASFGTGFVRHDNASRRTATHHWTRGNRMSLTLTLNPNRKPWIVGLQTGSPGSKENLIALLWMRDRGFIQSLLRFYLFKWAPLSKCFRSLPKWYVKVYRRGASLSKHFDWAHYQMDVWNQSNRLRKHSICRACLDNRWDRSLWNEVIKGQREWINCTRQFSRSLQATSLDWWSAAVCH